MLYIPFPDFSQAVKHLVANIFTGGTLDARVFTRRPTLRTTSNGASNRRGRMYAIVGGLGCGHDSEDLHGPAAPSYPSY
eukprot:6465052-Amphidinium_carterae.1